MDLSGRDQDLRNSNGLFFPHCGLGIDQMNPGVLPDVLEMPVKREYIQSRPTCRSGSFSAHSDRISSAVDQTKVALHDGFSALCAGEVASMISFTAADFALAPVAFIKLVNTFFDSAVALNCTITHKYLCLKYTSSVPKSKNKESA